MADTPKTDAELATPHFQHPQPQKSQPEAGQVFGGTSDVGDQVADLQKKISDMDNTRINFNTDLIGLVETVTVTPTGVPTSPYRQLKIFNGKWYYYDSLNNVWLSTPISPNAQTFTSSGTWTKPSGLTGTELVVVMAWGGGGGGGTGFTGNKGGSGGGGGACVVGNFRASDLGSTETVTIGTGGTNSSPTDGGNTTFGSHLTAYGGGRGGNAGNGASGGGGGGAFAIGGPGLSGTTTDEDGGVGGGPVGGAGGHHTGVIGGNGGESSFGGGGGGGFDNTDQVAGPGGASMYGGGGGGGGSNSTNGNGGNSFYGGGGGSGGRSATGGTSLIGGAGGSATAGSGTPGGNGSIPGGGAAGGADGTSLGGLGARGECRVWVY